MAKRSIPDEARRRLLRVISDEVSLVDRPANRKKFLLFKREGGEPDKDNLDENAGTPQLDNAEKVHPHGPHLCYCPECKTELEVETAEKCRTVHCPDCGTPMIAKEAGEDRMTDKKTDETQKQLPAPAASKIKSVLSSLGGLIGYGKPGDKSTLSPDATTKLKTILGALGALVGYPRPVKKDDAGEEVLDEEAVQAIVTKATEEEPEPKPVEKRGAKVSKARLALLKEAFSNIRDVLKDAGIEISEDLKKFMDEDLNIDLTEDDSIDDSKPPEKPAVPEAVTKALGDISTTLKEMQSDQKEQGERLTKVEEARGLPKGGDTKETEPIEKKEKSSFATSIGI